MGQHTGTLHILRTFADAIDKEGIFDVMYTLDNGSAEPEASVPHSMRRFYGEQQLTEFLKKHLGRKPPEVQSLLTLLQQDGRARITGLELGDKELGDLNLAA